MTFVLGARSRGHLVNVHPDMVRVVERAIRISAVDFAVIEGVRTPERQRVLYGQGRTARELAKVNLPASLARPHLPKVTWTLNSRHFINEQTGYGHAVDLLPAPYDWKDLRHFDLMAKAMREAIKHELLASRWDLRWGADWNQNGTPRERGESDSPHFEIVARRS